MAHEKHFYHESGGFMIIRPVVVGPLQVNCYVIADKQTAQAIVVDPGDEPDRIGEIIEKNALEVTAIVCTHGHFDHVGAVAELKKMTGAPVMLHREDFSLYDSASTAGSMWGFQIDPQPTPDVWLKEADVIRCGGIALSVMHTPGHSPGSVCLYGHGVLFSGDTLFAGSVGRTDLPGGDYAMLKQSFRRLMALPVETNVFTGHGENSTIGRELNENMFAGDMLS
jgi:glyoxylase-like metal-dependent hydrolase (beta-lactamase superfamily II)